MTDVKKRKEKKDIISEFVSFGLTVVSYVFSREKLRDNNFSEQHLPPPDDDVLLTMRARQRTVRDVRRRFVGGGKKKGDTSLISKLPVIKDIRRWRCHPL